MSNKIDKIHIVYFSGTGCTALSVKTLAQSFNNRKIETTISEIFQNEAPKIKANEMLVLMYPVYAADAPSAVYKWIASLESVERCMAVVISISGGGEISPNTATRVKPIKRLEKKGYLVNHEYSLCMPANFIAPTPNDLAIKLIQILPEKCDLVANDILESKVNRKKALTKDRLVVVLLEIEKFGAKIYGKTLKANQTCNSCGLCARKCPRGNIVMKDGKPKFGWRCVLCMRCVYDCPKQSIKARMPIIKNVAIKGGFNLKEIIKKSKDTIITKDKLQNHGTLWIGVMGYINDKKV